MGDLGAYTGYHLADRLRLCIICRDTTRRVLGVESGRRRKSGPRGEREAVKRKEMGGRVAGVLSGVSTPRTPGRCSCEGSENRLDFALCMAVALVFNDEL